VNLGQFDVLVLWFTFHLVFALKLFAHGGAEGGREKLFWAHWENDDGGFDDGVPLIAPNSDKWSGGSSILFWGALPCSISVEKSPMRKPSGWFLMVSRHTSRLARPPSPRPCTAARREQLNRSATGRVVNAEVDDKIKT
jgi:hypothetical protein